MRHVPDSAAPGAAAPARRGPGGDHRAPPLIRPCPAASARLLLVGVDFLEVGIHHLVATRLLAAGRAARRTARLGAAAGLLGRLLLLVERLAHLHRGLGELLP